MKRFFIILLYCGMGLMTAEAHAFLDHATPRVGSTGPTPSRVELWMTEDLEPAFTTCESL